MKSTFKLLSLALCIALAFTSCKDDDDDDGNGGGTAISNNQFKVGGTTYNLSSTGIYTNYGTGFGYDGYNLDLGITDKGFTLITNSSGQVDSVYGSGMVLYFECYTTDSTGFDLGTYHSDSIAPVPVKSFSFADYCINATTMDEGDCDEIKNCTLDVSKSGNVYTIIISGQNSKGEAVKGKFVGELLESVF